MIKINTLLKSTLILALTTPVFGASILTDYEQQIKKNQPSFTGFSAEKGKVFFLKKHSGGKPNTPSCSSCHNKDPKRSGQTRAGKIIEPLAISMSPERYSNKSKVEKWFRRNCKSVLGRTCTTMEKGNFIYFMKKQ